MSFFSRRRRSAGLPKHIDALNETLEKQNSALHVLRNGIIYGAGFVIGSTLFAAIILSLLAHIFGDIPFIGPLVDSAKNLAR